MSAFSSPPAPPKVPHPFTYMGTETLQWVPEALLCGKPLGSPLLSVAKLAEHAAELTPASEQLANASLRALLLPIPLPSLMDKDDAKAYLDQVAEKMVARAAKKRASRVLQRQRSGRTLRRGTWARLGALGERILRSARRRRRVLHMTRPENVCPECPECP